MECVELVRVFEDRPGDLLISPVRLEEKRSDPRECNENTDLKQSSFVFRFVR